MPYKTKEEKVQTQKRYAETLISQGLCIRCREPNTTSNKLYCLGCKEKKHRKTNQRSREVYVEGKATGHCTHCLEPAVEGNLFCQHHWVRAIAFSHLGSGSKKNIQLLEDLFESQNRQCYYTGIELQLGVNASIDHLHPKKRFPEFKNKIKNLVWCLHFVNVMKGDRTEEEFLQVCGSVLANAGQSDPEFSSIMSQKNQEFYVLHNHRFMKKIVPVEDSKEGFLAELTSDAPSLPPPGAHPPPRFSSVLDSLLSEEDDSDPDPT